MQSPRLSWLLSPLYVAALATGAKSFRDNPVIGSPALNRAGLHVKRVRLANAMVERRRKRLCALISEDDRAAFERDGFILKPNFLPPAEFAAVKRQVLSFRGPARHQFQGDGLTRRIALDSRALRQLPALRSLVESPEWLGLIRYVGSFMLEPLVYIQTIFSQVREAPPDPQTRLHADAFHSSVKAWLFLTDVAAQDGPFIYVPGSHRLTRRRLAWERNASTTAARSSDFQTARGSLRISPQAVRRLGFAAPKIFEVPENTLVVADTLGFHARGVSTRASVRLEIWAYGRRNPFLPWLGLDLAAMPLVKGRAVPLYWSAVDIGEKLHVASNPWRRIGVTGPAAPPDGGG
ncbi:MAG: phytanoyl-CoA dioxygenase family protein [Alphaproteobacteria bacterium]|nr:phytanoyl-CoA dioxygenase family protein [Alphaproteobacteria bacterium]